MSSLGKWIGLGLAAGIVCALAPIVGGDLTFEDLNIDLSRAEVEPEKEQAHLFEGLDLTRISLHPRRVTAPLADGKVAVLTLDPELQRSAEAVMKRYRMPEAGVVLLDRKSVV